MHPDQIIQTVSDWMRRHQMTQPGDVIYCALSGGADSVCLLRLLLALQKNLHITVLAVHVNHQLRGAESERDAVFCQTLCQRWQVPLTLIRRDVNAYAAANRCSVETAARECRYESFQNCVQFGGKIATAHTASDNLETAVHRLIRGGGLQGMSGIPPVRDCFIRPLLCITREQVESLLAYWKQSFLTDSTNLSDDYTRNRIRHYIIPQMRRMNPSAEHTSVRTLSALRMENDFVCQQSDIAYRQCHTESNCLTGLAAFHPALQIRCIARLLQEHEISYDGARLELLQSMLNQDGRQNLSGNVYCTAKQGTLRIEEILPPINFVKEAPMQLGVNRIYPGLQFIAVLEEDENCVKNLIVHKKFANSCLDYDKIKGTTILRSRKFGDRIQLAGCNFTSSVKKRIQEKVPHNRRTTLHFLEDAEGLIYAEQIGIADRAAPDATTKRLLCLTVQEVLNELDSNASRAP